MTEISRAKSPWQYKISEKDNHQLRVRRNVHRGRWTDYGRPFDSEEAARNALLKLESEGDE